MDRIPFTVYDILACVIAGFLVMLAADYAFGSQQLLHGTNLSLVSGFFLLVLAYIWGHILAHVAGFVLERRMVRGWLHAPEEILLRVNSAPSWWYGLFPGYYTPLPPRLAQRVLERGKTVGLPDPGPDLFAYCLPIVRREPTVAERLATFLNLYGFCRNVSLAAFVAAVVLGLGALMHPWPLLVGGAAAEWAWVVGALVTAIGLFYRYLKFIREYTLEVYRAFAARDNAGDDAHEV